MYDIYAPLVEDADLKLSYEEACDLVVKGLAPLGEEYCSLLKRALRKAGWMSVRRQAKEAGRTVRVCTDCTRMCFELSEDNARCLYDRP